MSNQPSPVLQDAGRFGWRELVASMSIVALIGLLVFPILHARGPHRIPETPFDISKLEQAIVQFKVTYGVEPPSGIVLYADFAGWNQDRRSRGLIRQLWPKFDFENCGGMKELPKEEIALNGSECLVFFLGGILHPERAEMIGFSKDPSHPFSAEGLSRDGPFFEFKGMYSTKESRWYGRLIDQNRNGLPEYLDPYPGQAKPYLYASHHSGKDYRIEDLGSAMRDVYRDEDGVPFKPKGFQIISPGADGEYGVGGLFDPENANAILSGDRVVERDNVTNFIAGTLGDFPDPRTAIWAAVGMINLIVFLLIAVACKRRWKVWLLLLVIALVIVTVGLTIPAITGISSMRRPSTQRCA